MEISRMNLLENEKGKVTLDLFLKTYGTRIVQDSEKLFLTDFLYPMLGENIRYVIPQYPFIDSEGRNRKIDFALVKDTKKIALEVNGETYHAEGIIPNDMFDDNLFRQNEILSHGWFLLRFSYSQLQDTKWRIRVVESLHRLFARNVPELISETVITPHHIQQLTLDALEFYRKKGWKKGIVILPTGLGKTFLSAFDAKRFTQKTKGRTLFIVHRLDILTQSKYAFEKVWPEARTGLLTGEIKEHVHDSNVLFASKDSLRDPDFLALLSPIEFDYIIVDEVHHGQAPTYQAILRHFSPKFLLGMTATPDRMDRKDIFELFEYSKVFEYSINDAIENGFLVPFTYYGLKDNIDYSNIRYNGNKYNVQDLDKYLIIEKRNKQILNEYLERGHGDKAIGFCASIIEILSQKFYDYSVSIKGYSKNTLRRYRNVINNYRQFANISATNQVTDDSVRSLFYWGRTERKWSVNTFIVHKLRHTFATLMLEGGCDIYSLSKMMGHSDIKTTTIYLAASAEHLRSQMTKHPLNDLVL